MSYASEVKEELSRQMPHARHCQIAELTAIITMCGGVSISATDRIKLKLQTENVYVVRKAASLLRQVFHISCEVSVRRGRHQTVYTAAVLSHEDAVKVLQAAHLLTEDYDIAETMALVDNLVVQKTCCKRCFLRGAFLAAGSVSDPKSSYHFEIVTVSLEKAQQLVEILSSLSFDAKITKRRQHYIVYIKEGDQIADLLGSMEASKALFALENVRILKEISGTINRKVNCETANLNKTVTAALTSIQDIEYIQSHGGLSELDDALRETALLRLQNPDASLAALGQMHRIPVGKSGVNHRIKKLSKIAEMMRQ